jgi:hypothetical protein
MKRRAVFSSVSGFLAVNLLAKDGKDSIWNPNINHKEKKFEAKYPHLRSISVAMDTLSTIEPKPPDPKLQDAVFEAVCKFFAEKKDDHARRKAAGELVKDLERIAMDYPQDMEARAFAAGTVWRNQYSFAFSAGPTCLSAPIPASRFGSAPPEQQVCRCSLRRTRGCPSVPQTRSS